MLNIAPGMKVVGIDGNHVGSVKAVHEANFVLDRPKPPDTIVPMEACEKVEGDMVWLRVKATEVHRQNWEVLGWQP